MNIRTDLVGKHFDSVLDVGGNVGEFAELARLLWPEATITSFEPLPAIAKMNEARSNGRWWTVRAAVSDHHGEDVIHLCENQHSASTMQDPGPARMEHFGIRDKFTDVMVRSAMLDDYLDRIHGSCLLKIDVEGHERQVLAGATVALDRVAAVIMEVQNDPSIFLGSHGATVLDAMLREHGLMFAGVADSFAAPSGRVLQFDGVWRRAAS